MSFASRTSPTCRSCGAPVEWAVWEQDRKAVPLDVGVFRDGTVARIGNGVVHLYTEEDTKAERPRLRLHHASCPDAGRWREKKAIMKRMEKRR